MIEQMTLFGERDPFDELAEHIVLWYEEGKAFEIKHGRTMPNFDKWLRDCFSSYQGGNGSTMLYGKWTFYEFSPRGLKLTNMHKLIPLSDGSGTEWESIFFPKAKILKRFGITDDQKDALKEDTWN